MNNKFPCGSERVVSQICTLFNLSQEVGSKENPFHTVFLIWLGEHSVQGDCMDDKQFSGTFFVTIWTWDSN